MTFLKAWRAAHGVTHLDIEEATGITGGYLSQIERGLQWCRPWMIKAIYDFTGGKVTANDHYAVLQPEVFGRTRLPKQRERPAAAHGVFKGSTRSGDPNGKGKRQEARK